MPFQVSPGVNVSEIDLTTVIPAVSTTEGGIAGHFSWGPVNQRVLVDSEDTLVQTYGKPNANTADDFFTAAATFCTTFKSNTLGAIKLAFSCSSETHDAIASAASTNILSVILVM